MTNWQPIETAPKDGKFVLVYARDNRYHSDGDQTEWVASYERGAWMYADGEYSVCPEPTHWMPLPEPPK